MEPLREKSWILSTFEKKNKQKLVSLNGTWINLLTEALLEKLTVARLVYKCQLPCTTTMFITVFSRTIYVTQFTLRKLSNERPIYISEL